MPTFSRATIFEIVKLLTFETHAVIEQFELEYDLPDTRGVGGLGPRQTAIIRYLIEHPGAKGPNGASLLFEIVERLLERHLVRKLGYSTKKYDPEEVFPNFVHLLRIDGYEIDGTKLIPALPEVVGPASDQNELANLLIKHGFITSKGHLDQALSAYTRGDWAASNAQLRSCIENLFDEIARSLDPTGASLLATSHARRTLLATMSPPFFLPALNEWDPGGNGFVQGFWKRLHPHGSHPGLSDEEDATLRLRLVLIVSSHFMRRFDARS